MRLYLDTSALLKLYLREPGSASLRLTTHSCRPWLFTSRVTYAETLAGLARACREGRITARTYRTKSQQFEENWRQLHVVEVTAAALLPCGDLIERYGLRGFDAVHLCAAQWLERPDFACFDDRLRSAAREEGLTLVPETV